MKQTTLTALTLFISGLGIMANLTDKQEFKNNTYKSIGVILACVCGYSLYKRVK